MEPIVLTDHDQPLLALISPAQADLLRRVREEIDWGELTFTIQDGEPRIIKEGIKTTKLGS